MRQRSPAQVYALLVGVLLTVLGIIGFFYNGTFTDATAVHDDVFGILSVNGWHNLLHILTGVVALALASSRTGSRTCTYGLGLFYLVVSVWGFILGGGHSILGIVPVDAAANTLHLLIGIAGVLAGVATAPERAPTAA